MRWFVLILLLLNVALYGWFVQEEESRQRMAQRELYAASDIAGLKLLSEVPVANLEPRVQRQAVSALRAQPGVEAATGADKEAVPVEGVKAVKPVKHVEPVAPEAKKKPPAALYCYQLGPIEALSQAQRLAEGVGDWVERSEILDRRRELAPDYWVYIKTNGKSKTVKALQEKLRSNGLESFRIRQGELAGHVSLGLYRSQESAQALYDALVAQGYPADIFEKKRYKKFYLIDVETEKSNFTALLTRALQGSEANSVKSEKKVCERLASAKGRE